MRQDHPRLDSDLISTVILPMVRSSPRISVPVLIANIRSEYHYTPSYRKVWIAKQKVLEKMHHGWDASYNYLWQWCQVLNRWVPGSITELQTKPAYYRDRLVQGSRIFYRIFWTFRQCREAFRYCKPLVQIDGTFLYGRYEHRLLIAVAQDGDRKILPIAFAITPGEGTDDWDFFLSNLRRHVVPQPDICVISDRGAGIIAAIESQGSLWDRTYHRYCLRHVGANYYKHHPSERERKQVLNMGK